MIFALAPPPHVCLTMRAIQITHLALQCQVELQRQVTSCKGRFQGLPCIGELPMLPHGQPPRKEVGHERT